MEAMLVNIEARPSAMNSGTYYRLTWVNIDDLTEWETDVQDTYRNWSKNGWQHIVQNQQYGLYANLRCQRTQTRSGIAIVTADSYPELLALCRDQAHAIDVILHEQHCRRQVSTMFDHLFDTQE